MEPGFVHLGWRELLAIWLAIVIIVDWAATRYGRPPRARHPAPDPGPRAGSRRSSIPEPPAGT